MSNRRDDNNMSPLKGEGKITIWRGKTISLTCETKYQANKKLKNGVEQYETMSVNLVTQ